MRGEAVGHFAASAPGADPRLYADVCLAGSMLKLRGL